MLAAFALSTAFNVANPIWESLDEPSHFQYVAYIAQHHALPGKDATLRTLGANGANCNNLRCLGQGQATVQPPLYYLLEAPFVLPIDLNRYVSWVGNPYFTWPNYPLRNAAAIHTLTEAFPYHGMVLGVHVLRAVSGLMAAVSVAAIYLTALTLTGSGVFATLAGAVAVLTPGLLLTSSSINDDNGAILFSSLALLCGAKAIASRHRAWLWVAGMAGLIVLALFTKTTTAFLVPLFGLLLWLLMATRLPAKWRRWWPAPLVLLVPGAVVAARWLTRRYSFVPAVHGQFWGLYRNLFETYWASFGWETFHLPHPFYWVLAGLFGLAIVGWIAGRPLPARAWLRSPGAGNVRAQGLAYLAVAFLLILVEVTARNLSTNDDGGTTHARFLFPAILASSILFAMGLARLPRPLALAGFSAFGCLSLVTIGYSLSILPGSFGPVAPVYGDTVSAGVQHPLVVDFDKNMRLVGWTELEPAGLKPGGALRVRLYWTTEESVDFDYSSFLRLESLAGASYRGQDHVPGKAIGLLTHSWQPGMVVPDDWTIPIPPDAKPGSYQLHLGVYDYRNMRPLPEIFTGQQMVTVATITLG